MSIASIYCVSAVLKSTLRCSLSRHHAGRSFTVHPKITNYGQVHNHCPKARKARTVGKSRLMTMRCRDHLSNGLSSEPYTHLSSIRAWPAYSSILSTAVALCQLSRQSTSTGASSESIMTVAQVAGNKLSSTTPGDHDFISPPLQHLAWQRD